MFLSYIYCSFVKEGYVKIKAGVFLFEINLLVYPVLYIC